MVEAVKNRHSVVLGMTRSGKTWFTGKMLKKLQAKGVHTIFVDPKHDADYEDLGTVCYSPIEAYALLLKKTPAIVMRTPATSPENAEALDRLVELLFQLQKTSGFRRIRRVVAIDELQLYAKKGNSRAIEMIWTVGAGVGITGVALTQRMQLLNDSLHPKREQVHLQDR